MYLHILLLLKWIFVQIEIEKWFVTLKSASYSQSYSNNCRYIQADNKICIYMVKYPALINSTNCCKICLIISLCKQFTDYVEPDKMLHCLLPNG